MAASVYTAQPIHSGTISATGHSAAFALNQNYNTVLAVIQIAAAPTGTSPTLTVQLSLSLDGTNFYTVGSATSALNTTGITQLSNSNCFAPWARLEYTIGGSATPTFTAVTINVSQS